MRKNIFFIQSDFHYIICKNIIASDHLNTNDCYFICGRGLKIDQNDNQLEFYDDEKRRFFPRLRFYAKNRRKINDFFDSCEVYFYSPLMNYFNRYSYFKDYIFFEEGLTAFSLHKTKHSKRGPLIDFFENIIISLLYFNACNNIKGYLKGFDFSRYSPYPDTTIITCNEGAYKNREQKNINRKVYELKSHLNFSIIETIPEHSYFIALDRFTTFGIVYDIENYKKCIRKMFEYLVNHNISEVWAKLHPADYMNPNGKIVFEDTVKDYGLKINYFNGRLEYLACEDKNIHFMGTNSTILFYAPVLGKSNESISFVRFLNNIDTSYSQFINSFGGIDEFVSFFSENVKCLE